MADDLDSVRDAWRTRALAAVQIRQGHGRKKTKKNFISEVTPSEHIPRVGIHLDAADRWFFADLPDDRQVCGDTFDKVATAVKILLKEMFTVRWFPVIVIEPYEMERYSPKWRDASPQQAVDFLRAGEIPDWVRPAAGLTMRRSYLCRRQGAARQWEWRELSWENYHSRINDSDDVSRIGFTTRYEGPTPAVDGEPANHRPNAVCLSYDESQWQQLTALQGQLQRLNLIIRSLFAEQNGVTALEARLNASTPLLGASPVDEIAAMAPMEVEETLSVPWADNESLQAFIAVKWGSREGPRIGDVVYVDNSSIYRLAAWHEDIQRFQMTVSPQHPCAGDESFNINVDGQVSFSGSLDPALVAPEELTPIDPVTPAFVLRRFWHFDLNVVGPGRRIDMQLPCRPYYWKRSR